MTTAVSCNSELVIQKISKWKKVKYAFCNLNKERSKPMETSFRDRSKIFSNLNVLDSKMNTTLSKICDNIAKQSRISLIKASILNLVVQHYEGGLTNRIGHAMWAIRQPWIYWYDMHKLHALE